VGTGRRRVTECVVRAYAKINLGLEVLGRRDDGYHELRTILQTIGLHDELRIRAGDEPGVRLTSNDQRIPLDSSNLAAVAAHLLAERTGHELALEIHLEKRIPAGAGLGGGSSNAATTLMALNHMWGSAVRRETLHEMAAQIGMDVPFFLYGGSALAVGRGDELYPLDVGSDLPIVLILPDFSISTAAAYSNLRLTKKRSGLTLQHFAWSDPYGRNGLGELVNDLEGATGEHSPSIQEYKTLLLERGATSAMMSGSGSAVFGVFPDASSAQSAAAALELVGVRTVQTTTLSAASYRRGWLAIEA
jgi:4-diphosphocytidyl-2-C-methyl-D-erythritol kinase